MVVSEKYKGYQTPQSIIGYAVRKCYFYKLSLRDVSEMLLDRELVLIMEPSVNSVKAT
jgi:putative transposase